MTGCGLAARGLPGSGTDLSLAFGWGADHRLLPALNGDLRLGGDGSRGRRCRRDRFRLRLGWCRRGLGGLRLGIGGAERRLFGGGGGALVLAGAAALLVMLGDEIHLVRHLLLLVLRQGDVQRRLARGRFRQLEAEGQDQHAVQGGGDKQQEAEALGTLRAPVDDVACLLSFH